MQNKYQFIREKSSRMSGAYDDEYVIDILDTYDTTSNEIMKHELVKNDLSDYPYIIVMRAGSRNLSDIVNSERVAKDMEKVRYMTSSLIKALSHMHERGQIHGKF